MTDSIVSETCSDCGKQNDAVESCFGCGRAVCPDCSAEVKHVGVQCVACGCKEDDRHGRE